jgi:hypothetical protein
MWFPGAIAIGVVLIVVLVAWFSRGRVKRR